MTEPAKVLYVVIADDDEPTARSMAELLMLLAPPLDVRLALDGREALTAATTGSTPHAVLLDVDMPLMSGPEVAAVIRRTSGGTPPLLVAVTAHGQEHVQAGAPVGSPDAFDEFDHVLTKPVDIERLVGLLDEVREK